MISRRKFLKFIAGLGAFGTSTAAYGVGIEPLLRLRVTRYRVTPQNWPAGFELKLAVIADLHASDPWMSPAHIESIVAHTNTLNADAVVMLGDYVAGHRYMVRQVAASEWAAALAKLKAPLGVHAVLGNHDYWDASEGEREGQGKTVAHRALEAAGIPVYENEVVRLTKGRHAFWLAGLGDQIAFLSQWHRGGAPRKGVD